MNFSGRLEWASVDAVVAAVPAVEASSLRCAALVVAFLACGLNKQSTWVNGHVLMLVACAGTLLLAPTTIIQCTVRSDVDEQKVFSSQLYAIMLLGFVLYMFLNRRTQDDKIWFSVYSAAAVTFSLVLAIQGIAYWRYRNTNPGFTLEHLTFSMLLSLVFALGNTRQVLRFHSDAAAPPADSRIDSHLVVDACIHAVNTFQLIGFAESMTVLLNHEGAALDPIDVYHTRRQGAISLLFVLLDVAALNFNDHKAKQSLLLSKFLMVVASGGLIYYYHHYRGLFPETTVFHAMAGLAVMATNALLGYFCHAHTIVLTEGSTLL